VNQWVCAKERRGVDVPLSRSFFVVGFLGFVVGGDFGGWLAERGFKCIDK